MNDEKNNPGCLLTVWPVVSEILSSVLLWAILITTAIAYLLWRGISERSAVAYIALGGILILATTGIGAAAVLIVQAIGERREEARERREQQRFRDNARENLAYLEAQSRLQRGIGQVQLVQSKSLLAENRDLRRLLPPANGEVQDIDGLAFDDDVFDELES